MKEVRIDFREADRRYDDLRRQHDNGDLDDAEFRARLEELSVQDADGRWWAKHRETGDWHFYDGSDWMPGTPPGYQERAHDPETPQARTQPPQRSGSDEPGEKRRGALPWVLAAGIFGVFVLVAAVAYLGAGEAGDTGDAGGGARGPATVELPDVVGTPGEEAERILEDRGFQVTSETREASEEEAGEVVAQSPSGDRAEKGSKVAITIGKAPEENESASGGERASEEPASEVKPAPGYGFVQGPAGALTIEIPSAWEADTGEASEREGGEFSWSFYAGEYLTSSITTASSLDGWYDENASGAYIVASENLAREHTDYELTHSLFFAPKAQNCAAGPYEDFDRPPYSGKIQTWYDCGANNMTTYSAVAAPEGRECVVVLSLRLASEADREAIEHILDTFDVDCGKVSDA